MEREEIKEKLINLIGKVSRLPEYEINEKSHFKTELGFDSLDDIELIMEAESEFNIQLPYHEVERIATVKDAIGIIMNELS